MTNISRDDRISLMNEIHRLESNMNICKPWIKSDFSALELRVSQSERELNLSEYNVELIKSNINNIEREFSALHVYPYQIMHLRKVWLITCLLIIAVHIFLGPEASLLWIAWKKFPALFNPIYGHVIGYIPIRYILFGVVIGTALVQTKNRSGIHADNYSIYTTASNAIVINNIISTCISYILLRLMKEKMLDISIMEIDFNQSLSNGGPIFILSLSISLVSERYLQNMFSLLSIELKNSNKKTDATTDR